MKKLTCLLSLVILLISCEKNEDNPINISFYPPIFEQYYITNIAFDKSGNAWLSNWNISWPPPYVFTNKLIKYNIETGETTIWDASDLPIPESTYINDIMVDKLNNVWIGSNSLIKFDGYKFTEYTADQTDIPLPSVRNLAADSYNNIWFSAASVHEGGIVKLNDTGFTVFSPENSIMHLNGVGAMTIDGNNSVWALQIGYNSDDKCILKIREELMSVYKTCDLGLPHSIYWSDIDTDSRNRIWCSTDYSILYDIPDPKPQLIRFDGTNCKILSFDHDSNIQDIAVDQDDNLWCLADNKLVVYDGNNWIIDSLIFSGVIASTIEISGDNRVWIGTSAGIFISK